MRLLLIAISVGIKEKDYSKNDKMGIIIEDLLIPFGTTIPYSKGEYVLYNTQML